jgi:hypothetical protein
MYSAGQQSDPGAGAQGGNASGAGSGAGSTGSGKDNVTDVDFEEVN